MTILEVYFIIGLIYAIGTAAYLWSKKFDEDMADKFNIIKPSNIAKTLIVFSVVPFWPMAVISGILK